MLSTLLDIHCDNKQAVSLMNKNSVLIDTKLRHVDIYQHWLREQYLAINH